MRRRRFLIASAVAVTCAPLLGAANAAPSGQRSLRVLLGNGTPTPIAAGGFEFGGRQYRGTYSRTSDGSVVNVVALEEYLYSVVPREMPSSWPPSALQIQAICARTYVLRHADPQHPYDVLPSSLDQVYEGVQTESADGCQAVDSTAGLVLRYGDAVANIAYSACCGGHTESSADAWNGEPLPYLNGVVCPYCVDSPDYRWSRDIGFDAIARAFEGELRGMGTLRDVQIASRDRSGRARTIELVGQNGTVAVRGSDFRMAVGAGVVRSLLILGLSVAPPAGGLDVPVLLLDGGGSGHGVGLCQWGARGIGIERGSFEQMASFYFPGTTVDTWTNVPSLPTTTSSRKR